MFPHVSSSHKETPCPERHANGEEVTWCTIQLQNFFQGDMTQKSVMKHTQEGVTSHRSFFKKERTDDFVSHQSTPHADRGESHSSYSYSVTS